MPNRYKVSTSMSTTSKRKEADTLSAKLRPGRVRRMAGSPNTGTARRLLRLARLVSRSARSGIRQRASGRNRGGTGVQLQRRAIVNVRYSSGRVKGAWKAHGRYVERESAAGSGEEREDDRLGLAEQRRLDELAEEWQKAGDQRLFKIIISPEDGATADFKVTARDMIGVLEHQTGERFEWAGVVHRNTDHPHAHILLRGRTGAGALLVLKPAMIRQTLRDEVQRSLTRQLGPRTVADLERQRTSDIHASRVTSLDRSLAKQIAGSHSDSVEVSPRTEHQARRLGTLGRFGLAQQDQGKWFVRSDFLAQLQQMKDLQDRARVMFRSGVAISDPHAPMEYGSQSLRLIGRVLLNSEDERTGQFQTAFETLDGKVVILRHDGTLRAAWARGDLKAGNVVAIDNLKSNPDRLYAVALGNDEEVLKDTTALDGIARRMRTMNLIVSENDKGWMGQLREALRSKEAQIGY